MSEVNWSDFVSFLKIKGSIQDCLFCCIESGKVLASTDGFTLQNYDISLPQDDKTEFVHEGANLVVLMSTKSDIPHPPQGLRLNRSNQKLQIIRDFEDLKEGISTKVVIGKSPQGGACIARSKQIIIVGTYVESDGHLVSQCLDNVILMAKFLGKQGL
jgi:hypothetical protein